MVLYRFGKFTKGKFESSLLKISSCRLSYGKIFKLLIHLDPTYLTLNNSQLNKVAVGSMIVKKDCVRRLSNIVC